MSGKITAPGGGLAWADRRNDKPVTPPVDVVYSLEEKVSWPVATGIAIQFLAIQAVYLLVPIAVAQAAGFDADRTIGFLSMTVVAMAIAGTVYSLPFGPVGSGYALPAISTPAALATYVIALGGGMELPEIGASLVVGGLLGLVLMIALPNATRLLPVEITGVISMSLGISLVPTAVDLGFAQEQAADGAIVLATTALIAILSILPWRFAAFGLALGGTVATVAVLALGLDDVASLPQALPAFALPRPIWPDFSRIDPGFVATCFILSLTLLPSAVGGALLLQRAGDADWVKPDPGPLQRACVASMVLMIPPGLLGGMATNVSSGAVGLAVATRVLARRPVLVNAVLLLALAASPWLLGVLLLLPGTVAAAMLLFIACFLMTSGAQQIASRVLDVRRICAVGFGLVAALLMTIAPDRFDTLLPNMLLSPVVFAFVVGLGTHLLSLPLARRRGRAEIALKAGCDRDILRHVESVAGARALRRPTADVISHAAVEIVELLLERGLGKAAIDVVASEGKVILKVSHEGPPLPHPTRTPTAESVLDEGPAREGFAMWMAARRAERCRIQEGAGQASVELVFVE